VPARDRFWHPVTTVTTQLEVVVRLALIRGRGCQRFCNVSAVKVSDPKAPDAAPYRGPIKIHDQQDNFPDGNYELVLGAQVFVLTKSGGKYQPIA